MRIVGRIKKMAVDIYFYNGVVYDTFLEARREMMREFPRKDKKPKTRKVGA